MTRELLLAPLALTLFALPSPAQTFELGDPQQTNLVHELEDGTVLAVDKFGAQLFRDWQEYVHSDFFHIHNMRCGAYGPVDSGQLEATSDCTSSFTDPTGYEPNGGAVYQIPVVVHILQHPNGNGSIPDARVHSQIDVLNEDFRAIAGSLGAPGTDVRIEFYLATVDPNGNATTGINRHTSSQWYNDSGNYAAAVGWDTNRYLNIYTNTASGNLGYAYVPNGGGVVGSSFDGVRILWTAFGLDAPIGYPYNLGRTTTHEVGHYLGLYHTFQGGCASASNCYANGDLICDTNPEGSPNSFPCDRSTCGSPDPTHNYMDYSYDLCMDNFTPDQAARMRCTLENWRVDLAGPSGPVNQPPSVSITSPSSGASFPLGDPVTFTGTASDPEDGGLSGSIQWSSSQDGLFGTGASVTTSSLSGGSHTITALVTDSNGAGDSASISITITTGGGSGIQLSGNAYKVKGRVSVDLTWSGATGGSVDIYRDGAFLTSTGNDGSYTDQTGLKGGGSLTYQVCEQGGGPCSATITVTY